MKGRVWLGIAVMAWMNIATLVSLLLAPGTAMATGETYSFSGANTIVCTGGSCASQATNTLTLTGGPTNFTGTYTVLSNASAKTGPSSCTETIKVAITGQSGGSYNANASSTAGTTNGNTCATLTLTSPIPISDPKKVGPSAAQITASGNTPTAATGTAATTADNTDAPDCNAGPAVSWLICDIIIKPLLGLIDWIRAEIIVPFLKTDALTQKVTETTYDANGNPQTQIVDNPTYKIWQDFRNIANLVFILIFFLVIFGTAMGFDNYTIKKMLPRVIAGAVLVQLSWNICQIIIDLGNVLGQGILSLTNAVVPNAQVNFGDNIQSLFLTAGTGILIVASAQAAIALFTPAVLFTMLFAFLTVFFTLILRKILILIIVCLSPFIVILEILPNTQKWAKMLEQNFLKLILMYPAAMALFMGGQIFAVVAGTIPNTNNSDKFARFTAPMFELVGLTLPLFLIPLTFKAGGTFLSMGQNAIGKATGALDKRYGKDSQTGKDQLQAKEWKNATRHQSALEAADKADKAGNAFAKRRAQMAAGFFRVRSGHSGFVGTKGGMATQMRMEEATNKGTAGLGQFQALKDARGDKKSDPNKKLPIASGKELVALEAEAALSKRISEHAELEQHTITQQRLNQRSSDRLSQQREAAANKTIQQRIVEAGFRKVYEADKEIDPDTGKVTGKLARNADGSVRYKVLRDADGNAILDANGKEQKIFKGYVNNMSPSDATTELREETEAHLKELKDSHGEKGSMDIIGANMASMGRSGSGALADSELLNQYFGRNRDQTVDPAALGEYTQTLLEMGLSQVDKKKHPTLFQPASVAEEGVSASDLRGMHYRGKETHFVDVTSADLPSGEREARISETAKALAAAKNNRNNWSEWNDQDKAVVMRFLESPDPAIADQAQEALKDAFGRDTADPTKSKNYDDFRAEIEDSAHAALAGDFKYKALPTPALRLDPADPTGKTPLKNPDGSIVGYKSYQDPAQAPEWWDTSDPDKPVVEKPRGL